jgi:hypothetical protein
MLAAGAVLALACGSGVAAAEESADTVSDLRCFVTVSMLARQVEEANKGSVMVVAVYYLGKLDGRTPKLDLAAQAESLARKLWSEDYRAEAVRCSTAMGARGEQLLAVSQRLQASAGAQAPAPATPAAK